ncbi:MAG: hypothetical protein ACK4TA_25970 [Saprospiraceae bacterium]
MKLIITTCIIISCLQMSAAQVSHYADSLQLRDGAWKTGQIRYMNRGSKVQLEIAPGYIQVYKVKDIQRIIISLPEDERKHKVSNKAITVKERCEKPYDFRERGLYSITYFGTINGIGHSGDVQLGLSMQQVVGFQRNRMFGTGIGIGLENFSVGNANGPLVLPVYAEARGYFLKKNKTPYYALNLGYGFAFKDEDQGILKAKGGLLLHPAIGFRLGARDSVNFLFDLGYKFQWATLTRNFGGWSRETLEQELVYKRFSVRLGLIF